MFVGLFRKSMSSVFTSASRTQSSLFTRNLGLRFNSTVLKQAKPPKPPTGIKKLIQQYGYSALGIYMGLSLLDLPICFLVVHSAGEDKIRELQDKFLIFIGYKKEVPVSTDPSQPVAVDENGEVVEIEKSSTLVTEFALAYAIHKSLIFIRLPITAAITPWAVKQLRSWGFNIGKAAMVKAATKVKKFDPTGKSAKL